MREIKFRIRIPNKEPLKGGHWGGYRQLDSELLICDRNNFPWTWTAKQDGVIWCQYTGLKDMNGVEIYENYLLKWDGGVYQVKFLNGCWELWTTGDLDYDRPNLYMIIKPSGLNVEIVGSVYENPELLKAGMRREEGEKGSNPVPV